MQSGKDCEFNMTDRSGRKAVVIVEEVAAIEEKPGTLSQDPGKQSTRASLPTPTVR